MTQNQSTGTLALGAKDAFDARNLKARKMRVRNLAIEQKHWLRGDAYATAFFNALSAVFPQGEAFMIECLRPWQNRLDGKLAEDVRTFIEQEAAHSREHAGLNRALIRSGYDIAPLDKVIRQFVDFFKDSGEITKLGATMCIEHLTAIIAHELLTKPEHFDGCDEEIKQLWVWHSIEEIDHKAVAFDVWMYATRDWSGFRRWLTRSAMHVAVSTSFFINRTRGQVELMRQDGVRWPVALPGLIRSGFGKGGIGRNIMRHWFQFMKPGFHPWQIDDRDLIVKGEALLAAMQPADVAPDALVADQAGPAISKAA